jgi:hypothetical protein
VESSLHIVVKTGSPLPSVRFRIVFFSQATDSVRRLRVDIQQSLGVTVDVNASDGECGSDIGGDNAISIDSIDVMEADPGDGGDSGHGCSGGGS